jgi:trk system potassium uptake protein TrkH
VVALQLTQALPGVEALFEVVSALGTVGLSIGATARLDEIGKVIVMVCMFVGRVGGLSLLMFMSQRGTPSMVVRLEEEIDVG